MEDSILKRIHKIQVEILDEIVRICEKYSLEYCLIGGTLLGAIRHKGFIPWDDDRSGCSYRNPGCLSQQEGETH